MSTDRPCDRAAGFLIVLMPAAFFELVLGNRCASFNNRRLSLLLCLSPCLQYECTQALNLGILRLQPVAHLRFKPGQPSQSHDVTHFPSPWAPTLASSALAISTMRSSSRQRQMMSRAAAWRWAGVLASSCLR